MKKSGNKKALKTMLNLLDCYANNSPNFWIKRTSDYNSRDQDIIIEGLFSVDCESTQSYFLALKYVFISRSSKQIFSDRKNSAHTGYVSLYTLQMQHYYDKKKAKFDIVLKRGNNTCTLSTKNGEMYKIWIKCMKFFIIGDNQSELYFYPNLVRQHKNHYQCLITEKVTGLVSNATIYSKDFIENNNYRIISFLTNLRALSDVRVIKIKHVFLLKEDLIIIYEELEDNMICMKTYLDEIVNLRLQNNQKEIDSKLINPKKLENIAIDQFQLVQYLNTENFVLRQLTPDFIFIKNLLDNNNEYSCVKILCPIDGTYLDEKQYEVISYVPGFTSPEIMLRKPQSNNTDLFVLGNTLFSQITGKFLFQSKYGLDVLLKVISDREVDEKHFKDIPPNWKEIILACVKKNPIFRGESFDLMQQNFEECRDVLDRPTSENKSKYYSMQNCPNNKELKNRIGIKSEPVFKVNSFENEKLRKSLSDLRSNKAYQRQMFENTSGRTHFDFRHKLCDFFEHDKFYITPQPEILRSIYFGLTINKFLQIKNQTQIIHTKHSKEEFNAHFDLDSEDEISIPSLPNFTYNQKNLFK